MNTGHDGSLSTGHANSPRDMLNRLETLVLMGMDIPLAAVRQQIASGIDILVHLGRLRDGSRRVLQIDEIVGIENERVSLQTLFQFQEKKGQKGGVEGVLGATGKKLRNQEKCQRAGVSLL